MSDKKLGWIGVDLDGTLAKYDSWGDGSIGEPVPLMLMRVKRWLKQGKDVRIFTARVSHPAHKEAALRAIQDWTEQHVGVRLPVTNVKDFEMIDLYDDRAYRVEKNTGRIIGEKSIKLKEPEDD